jgi:superfamily II DNA or RNA helicase/diadenosine tetraphosphate (Ap4A) HIT family hydrolase/HKD family nuclease
MDAACPFCSPDTDRVFYRDSLVIGLWDAFPVAPGHALLVPVRHVKNWFEATVEERMALTRAIDAARVAIESKVHADGYNIGINSGEAAGQTVFHLHVHVIPRRHGDVEDPRGGVRHVIAAKANYLRDTDDRLAVTPHAVTGQVLVKGTDDPLLPHLKQHLAGARSADLAVAFTLRSGLDLVQPYLQDLLDRGGSLRVLTGDYLGATDPDALLRLLDLEGRVECRVYETAPVGDPHAFGGSFHPKAYLFEHSDGSGAAFIGSSNLSHTALTGGVEWNYKVLESRDRAGLAEIRAAFNELFRSSRTRPLTSAWIDAYRERRLADPVQRQMAAVEVAADPAMAIPEPHAIQVEALLALEATRTAGKRAGLVVLATGLGKTWLSAFDSRSFQRVLFIAHREEILGQALATFRTIRPHDSMGRYTGTERDPGASVLFASVQTLSRLEHLRRFAADEFDYLVVDEFHHAEARTYRKVIDYFKPTFLLGLTATPERSDGADLLALCEDNLVYRCELVKGIQKELLCPFRYFGVPDTVDYKNIPWRNKKFDEDKLTEAVATQARAENTLQQYRKRAGSRTIAFCVSQRHSDFMRDFFVRNGITARSVHSGATSDPRAASLDALKEGRLSVLCAVDMFNEGVDVPELDTVMMLRPTESRIVWLQQFGRGLRKSSPDKKLTVIDYIGNHRSFMLKPQALFGLPSGDREVLNLLTRLEQGLEELPPGCEVTYELEVKNMFRELLRRGDGAVELLTRRYQDFTEMIGVRPTASEMYREGYNPRAMKAAHGSWLGFVRSQQGLLAHEAEAHEALRAFLDALETTEMSKSYKMLTLTAMLNRNCLPGEIAVDDLVQEVASLGRQHLRIADDLGVAATDAGALRRLMLTQPIPAWCEGKGTGGISYFSLRGNKFQFMPSIGENLVTPFQELVREIVDWRLAEYFSRSGTAVAEEYALKVSRAGEQPMLFLPDRNTHPELPEGWTTIRANGQLLSANFVKVALNVVRVPGSDDNELPRLLTGWFGPDAGRPGTKHQVTLCRDGADWVLQPQAVSSGAAVPYKAYVRADIPPLFSLKHSEFWRQGFIRQGKLTFLLVTLDKSAHEAEFKYQDHFVSPTEFQWQSQNQTAQNSKPGQSIRDHRKMGIDVHLFVRAKGKTPEGRGAPFYYLGCVDFKSWRGDKPITVMWTMRSPIPRLLWKELGVPPTDSAGHVPT